MLPSLVTTWTKSACFIQVVYLSVFFVQARVPFMIENSDTDIMGNSKWVPLELSALLLSILF